MLRINGLPMYSEIKHSLFIAILRLGLQEKKRKKQASVQLNETQNTILKNQIHINIPKYLTMNNRMITLSS